MKLIRQISLFAILLLLIPAACEKEEFKLTPETDYSSFSSSKKAGADAPDVYQLLAGQNMDVGEVQVWNDDNYLYVKYIVDEEGWCLTETHLHVAMSPEDVPQKNGNAIPGQFDFKEEHDCVMMFTDTIELDPSWECENDIVIAAHAVVQNTYTCSDPVVLLATENNHPDSATQVEMEARIWSISVSGTTEMISNLSAPVRGTDTDNFNGNGYDEITNRFYFTDYGKFGGPYYQGPSPLYFNDLEGTQLSAGTLTGGASGGTVYNGKYYYIGERTDDLWEVTFNADGTINTQTKLADIFGDGGKVLAFGDIDIRAENGTEVIYGSATEIPGYNVVFFKMNLDGTGYTVIKSGALYGAGGTQISFGSDGVLYGVNARTPFELFSIDTSDGSTEFIKSLPVAFSDLASGPVCEPEEETAWGEGMRFTDQGNWATYFTYTITCCNEWIVYGSNLGTGTDTDDAIYAIDLNNKTRTLVYNPGAIDANMNYPNANAYDPVNQRIFFGTDDGRFFYHEIGSGTHVQLASDFGAMAGGSWYNGKYYYVQNGTNRLYEVTISGTSATRAQIGTVPTSNGYGDLAFDPENPGLFIASAGDVWYTYDLNTNTSTILTLTTTDYSYHKQLAYGSDGTLYAVNATTGEFFTVVYSVTPAEVALTPFWESGYSFTDLASGPLCP